MALLQAKGALLRRLQGALRQRQAGGRAGAALSGASVPSGEALDQNEIIYDTRQRASLERKPTDRSCLEQADLSSPGRPRS